MQATLRTLLLSLMLAAGSCALGAQRALLVGVSELVNQPASLWLQAPRNDVMLMRQSLQQQGLSSADITVLADGVAGAGVPDSQQIRDALARLLAQSKGGDFVVLYFSGHGTRVRDATKRYQEPDGLAENFLARDARLATGNGTPVAGAMRDVDFDGWIQAFLAKDVFVWALFDTCSAASMTRGAARSSTPVDNGPPDDEVRFRGIQADELARGVSGPVVDMAAPPVAPVPRARYVAFFASESHQVTPELKLPRKDRTARPQGLLTWSVSQALARKPATFRDLFNDVVAFYPPVIDELEARFPQRELPSPVAEGNLDVPVFSNAPAPLSTRPAWPARRSGASLVMSVGQLDGLEPQQEVRVVATLDDGSLRSAAARLDAVDIASSRMQVPATLVDQGNASLWTVTPLVDPPAVVLRVQADRKLPDGLSLAYPAAIRAVRSGDADVRLQDKGGAQSIEILSPTLVAMVDAAPADAVQDAGSVRSQLLALAELKWLARLNALAKDGSLDGFDATLEVWAGDKLVRSSPATQAAQGQSLLAEGERAALLVRNTSGQSIDLVIVGINAAGAVQQVYPQAISETNRFERGTREAPAAKRFELPWLDASHGGRLLLVASPAAPYSAPRLFGAAPPAPLADVRVRGQLGPDKDRQVSSALVAWRR